MVRVIAFDADDTLWHSQRGFDRVEDEFRALMADFGDPEELHRALYRVELANMPTFGYGVKAFTLSLVETALRVSEGAVDTRILQRILDAGKALLREPVELLDGAFEAVSAVAPAHRLLLVTKGDLLHQERKLAESGLVDYFDRVDIVSEKDRSTYARILEEEGVEASDFLMVGNSLRSDVLPVIDVGGWAVHVPYETTWIHEDVDPDEPGIEHAFTISSLSELAGVVKELVEGRGTEAAPARP